MNSKIDQGQLHSVKAAVQVYLYPDAQIDVGESLGNKIKELGGKWSRTIDQDTTHLVWFNGATQVVEEGMKKGLFLVSPFWVEECYAKSEHSNEDRFLPKFSKKVNAGVAHRNKSSPTMMSSGAESNQDKSDDIDDTALTNLVKAKISPNVPSILAKSKRIIDEGGNDACSHTRKKTRPLTTPKKCLAFSSPPGNGPSSNGWACGSCFQPNPVKRETCTGCKRPKNMEMLRRSTRKITPTLICCSACACEYDAGPTVGIFLTCPQCGYADLKSEKKSPASNTRTRNEAEEKENHNPRKGPESRDNVSRKNKSPVEHRSSQTKLSNGGSDSEKVPPKKVEKHSGEWQCSTCTFLNVWHRENCEMCQNVRPEIVDEIADKNSEEDAAVHTPENNDDESPAACEDDIHERELEQKKLVPTVAPSHRTLRKLENKIWTCEECFHGNAATALRCGTCSFAPDRKTLMFKTVKEEDSIDSPVESESSESYESYESYCDVVPSSRSNEHITILLSHRDRTWYKRFRAKYEKSSLRYDVLDVDKCPLEPTHVIVSDTAKACRELTVGIACGAYIVCSEWLKASINLGKWVDESPFTVYNSPSIPDIFESDTIYLAAAMKKHSRAKISMVDLQIASLGGRRTESVESATVVISLSSDSAPKKMIERTRDLHVPLVDLRWVEDSILSGRRLEPEYYAIGTEI